MKPRFLLIILFSLLLPALCLAAPKKKAPVAADRAIKPVKNQDGRRIALVIGNGDYKHTGRLANPVNDARLMAETLKEVGFDLHGGKAQLNLSRDDMLSAIEEFGDRIGRGDTALFFYAGHGMQVRGENYLIPVNANIKNEAEVRVKSVEAALLFAKLEGAKNGVNIVILDACRNNPFGRSFRSANNGLAQVSAPSGTIVAFSTAPNQVAEDGQGGNSTYTRELSRYIKAPGLRIEDVFKRVRVSVEDKTSGSQQPWENTSLKGDFSFVEGADDTAERRIREAEERARRAEQQLAQQNRTQVTMAPRPQSPSVRPVQAGNDPIPTRPQLPFTVDEGIWRSLEASEVYRNWPKPKVKSVKIIDKHSGLVESLSHSILYNNTVTINPIGNSCKKRVHSSYMDGSNVKSTAEFYSCAGILIFVNYPQSLTNSYSASKIEIQGSLFPIHVGAEQMTKVSYHHNQNISKMKVVSRTEAKNLHPNLTGVAWMISQEDVVRGKSDVNYYIEDLGIFLSDIAVFDYTKKKYVFPSNGYQNILTITSADGTLSRQIYTYDKYDWTVE